MSEHLRQSSVKPRDSRSSISSQELTEEVDRTLAEFDDDWKYIEKLVEDELSRSSCSLPTLPLSPLVTASHYSEICMSLGNLEDVENSVHDSITLTPATKTEDHKTWEFVDDLHTESLRSDRDSENSVSSKKFNEEINSTLQEEFENKNWTNEDNMENLRKKQLLFLFPPPLLTPSTSPVWLVPPQSHTNTVLTQGGVQEDMFRPPSPTFTHHAPLHAHPPSIGASLKVTSNTNAPFSLRAQYDHMFRPPLPTFTHHAPLHAHPPSIGAPLEVTSNTNAPFSLGAEDDEMFGPPTFTHHASPSPLELPAVQQMIVRPPVLPAGGADSQELWKFLPVEVKDRYFEKARLEQRIHKQQHPG